MIFTGFGRNSFVLTIGSSIVNINTYIVRYEKGDSEYVKFVKII